MKQKSIQMFIMIKWQKKALFCICLSMILIDSVLKMGKHYYHQVFLEECKYIVKENEVIKHIAENLEILTLKKVS